MIYYSNRMNTIINFTSRIIRKGGTFMIRNICMEHISRQIDKQIHIASYKTYYMK